MKNSLIEEMDKLRSSAIIWFTIGWAIWFGGFIAKDLIANKILLLILISIGFVGYIIFLVNVLRLSKLRKVVDSDSKLKDALFDEFTLHNRNKSAVVGCWTFMGAIAVCFGLSLFTDITALTVCEITLFFGILSMLISFLIFNRS